MFREYDIRGRVCDEELCPENVYKIVKAYSKYLLKRNITRAVVGYDNRKCSPSFSESAINAPTVFGMLPIPSCKHAPSCMCSMKPSSVCFVAAA